MLASFRISKYR